MEDDPPKMLKLTKAFCNSALNHKAVISDHLRRVSQDLVHRPMTGKLFKMSSSPDRSHTKFWQRYSPLVCLPPSTVDCSDVAMISLDAVILCLDKRLLSIKTGGHLSHWKAKRELFSLMAELLWQQKMQKPRPQWTRDAFLERPSS